MYSQSNDQPDLALSVVALAKSAGCSRSRIYEEIAGGRLRARKLGRRTLITRADAEEWLKSLPQVKPKSTAIKRDETTGLTPTAQETPMQMKGFSIHAGKKIQTKKSLRAMAKSSALAPMREVLAGLDHATPSAAQHYGTGSNAAAPRPRRDRPER